MKVLAIGAVLVVTYLTIGAILFHFDVTRRRAKGGAYRRAVRKLGLAHVLGILWLIAPGYILFWGLGHDLREKLSDWWFTKVTRNNRPID